MREEEREREREVEGGGGGGGGGAQTHREMSSADLEQPEHVHRSFTQ